MAKIKDRPDLEPDDEVRITASPAPGETAAEVAGVAPPSDLKGQAIQGLTEIPGNFGSIADLGARLAGTVATGQNAFAPEVGGTQIGPPLAAAGESLYETITGGEARDPRTPGEERIRAVTRGVGEAALTGPIGKTGQGLAFLMRKLGLETAGNVSGELFGAEVKNRGGGAGAQFAANMVGQQAPGAALATRRAGPVLQQFTQAGRAEEAKEAVKETLQEQIPKVPQARAALVEEVAGTPAFGQARTGQVLSEDAPGVLALEKATAQVGGKEAANLRTTAVNMRELNELAAKEALDIGFPAGEPGHAMAHWLSESAALSDKVKKAYLGLGDLQGIPTNATHRALDEAFEITGHPLRKRLPKSVMKDMAEWGNTVNLNELRLTRSDITARIRGFTKNGRVKPGKEMEVKILSVLRDGIDQAMDDAAAMGGFEEVEALRRAIRYRAEKGLKFDKQSILDNVMREQDDLNKGFKKIMGLPSPSKELDKAFLVLGDNPEAWAGMQRLMRDFVFGEEGLEGLDSLRKIKAAKGRIGRFEKSWEVMYGTGSAKRARRFLDRLAKLQTGITGKEAIRGVNADSPDLSLVRNAAVVIDAARFSFRNAAVRATFFATQRLPRVQADADRLLAQALVDPEIAIGFLEPLNPREFQKWTDNIQRFLARPVRSLAGAKERSEQPLEGGETQ